MIMMMIIIIYGRRDVLRACACRRLGLNNPRRARFDSVARHFSICVLCPIVFLRREHRPASTFPPDLRRNTFFIGRT